MIKTERLAARIRQSVRIDDNGCWLWAKSRSRNGYGRAALGGGRGVGAHRIAYQVFVGRIPDGLHVCHRCDVRECVNPDHLFVGTRSQNLMDASRKGRLSRTHQLKGSAHPSAKLTESKVEEILGLLSGGCSKKSLSKKYGVSQRTILLIARGQIWEPEYHADIQRRLSLMLASPQEHKKPAIKQSYGPLFEFMEAAE